MKRKSRSLLIAGCALLLVGAILLITQHHPSHARTIVTMVLVVLGAGLVWFWNRPAQAVVSKPATPALSTVLRGYDRAVVDKLLGVGRDALASGDADQRAGAKAALTGAEIPVVGRGYDRLQVHEAFGALADELDAAAN